MRIRLIEHWPINPNVNLSRRNVENLLIRHVSSRLIVNVQLHHQSRVEKEKNFISRSIMRPMSGDNDVGLCIASLLLLLNFNRYAHSHISFDSAASRISYRTNERTNDIRSSSSTNEKCFI